MALWLNGVEIFPDHTDEEQDARLADMIDQCEDCGTHTPDIRAFGTDHSLLCPECRPGATRNVAAAEQSYAATQGFIPASDPRSSVDPFYKR